MFDSTRSQLPVAVIGAGPVGLAAAAHLLQRRLPFVILEAGPGVAANLESVRHVRLFSPWRYNIDRAARELLERNGWTPPPLDRLPTAGEIVDDYLAPLARVPAVARALRVDTRVVQITRARARYAGKRVLVVGAGHSAVGTLVALATLADESPATTIVWAIRGDNLARVIGGGDADGLPARGALGQRLKALYDAGRLELHDNFRIAEVRREGAKLRVLAEPHSGIGKEIGEVDEIIASTGSRPDLALAAELRLKLDAWLESTEQLAPLIDPNVHSCGTVRPHGHRELAHPESGYYAVGAKSYGRAPNFLMATGYEQVRSVVAALAGDLAAADDVQLELPETGVCSASFPPTDAAAAETGCCGGPAPAEVDACCVADAEAKESGAAGCGCGPAPSALALATEPVAGGNAGARKSRVPIAIRVKTTCCR